MRRARWILTPQPGDAKPVIYHCVTRAVNRDFVLGDLEKEQLRRYMRMYEAFSGIRVINYVFMSNHLHLVLEITPQPEGGLTDEGLLERLRAIYTEAQVAEVARELAGARKLVTEGLGDLAMVEAIHARYTYRMHDLSEFMKSYLQRYTQWHNSIHHRRGHLWESRFRSVIAEPGEAVQAISAYVTLNPVRAGIVSDPAAYRWSGYGEALGSGGRGDGNKAREGLVRGCMGHHGIGFEAEKWREAVNLHRIAMGEQLAENLAEATRRALLRVDVSSLGVHLNAGASPDNEAHAAGETWPAIAESANATALESLGPEFLAASSGAVGVFAANAGDPKDKPTAAAVGDTEAESSQGRSQQREGGPQIGGPAPVAAVLRDIGVAAMLKYRIRYFTDGVAIGSREFVNELFRQGRHRFGPRRKEGARKMRGPAAAAAGVLWSMRDLRM